MDEFDGALEQGPDGLQDGNQGQPPEPQVRDENGRFVPIERFEAVSKPYEQYRKLGKIEDIQKRLDEHSRWNAAIEQHRKKTGVNPETEEIRTRLLQVYPELQGVNELGSIKEQLAQFQAWQRTMNLQKADSYLADSLKRQNMSLSADEMSDFSIILYNRMDAEQRAALESGNFAAIDAALSTLPKTGLFGRLANKPAPPKPPTRPGSQGSPQPHKNENAETMQDAHKAAWEQFTQKE